MTEVALIRRQPPNRQAGAAPCQSMVPAPTPADEPRRLAALKALQILDTEPEAAFDNITLLAQQTFRVAMVVVSLVDDARQWFKSKQGIAACETPRSISFCGHAILDDQPLVVEDALEDPRFRGNPLVTGAPFIRSYAGYPVRDPSGYRVGTLCLIDPAPRCYSPDDIAILKGFAGLVEQAFVGVAASRAQAFAFNQFDAILDATPVGFVLVDSQGCIELVNRRICMLLDYEPNELVGQSVDILLPQRFRNGHLQKLAAYFGSPTARPMGGGRDLYAARRDATELPVEIGLTPLDTVSGRRVLATIVDITERKRAEAKLISANARLEEFAYVASHDLRSPLRGIGDLLTWIQEDLGAITNDKVLKNFERAGSRVRRLEQMIDHLLTYARIGEVDGVLSEIDLHALADSIVELQPRPAGITVEIDIPETRVMVAVTPLGTVLRNLIGNAIKHHDRQSGLIRVSARLNHGQIVFAVTDDGPGIPPRAQPRIFNLFQTASAKSGGSGLGLAICKRLVETYGGTIAVTAVEGCRGTTFQFSWPISENGTTHVR